MLRDERFKIVIGRDGKTLQLFDLAADAHEQRNLCGHPEYDLHELRMRSKLLERLAGQTFRPFGLSGLEDDSAMGLYGHFQPPATAPSPYRSWSETLNSVY